MTNAHDMEYYTTTTISTPTIMLVIGLVIILIGGIAATFVKDEGKMIKLVTSFVSVGGCITIGSVVMLLV